MSTVETARMTDEGLLLPHEMVQDLGEVEVVRRPDYILIKSKVIHDRELHDRARKVLREAGLLVEVHRKPLPEVSPEERAELARRLASGRPLSEIVIEEREEGW
jgi:hypothetical protein